MNSRGRCGITRLNSDTDCALVGGVVWIKLMCRCPAYSECLAHKNHQDDQKSFQLSLQVNPRISTLTLQRHPQPGHCASITRIQGLMRVPFPSEYVRGGEHQRANHRQRFLIVMQRLDKSCGDELRQSCNCLLYTSPSPRDQRGSRMPSSA